MSKAKYIFERQETKKIKINSELEILVVNKFSTFKDFYNIAFEIYKNDDFWVAPLWIDFAGFFKTKNIFWNHAKTQLFIAYKNKKVVGRICAVIDNLYIDYNNEKIGFFGFFESINDKTVAIELLKAAQDWLKSEGMNQMHGPINGRVDVGSGFVIKGFNTIPFLIGHYSKEYYNDFAKEFEMKKCIDLVSYLIDLTKPISPKIKQKAEECESKGVKIRKFKRLFFRREMDWWIQKFMVVFKDRWGYTPITEEEVITRFGIKELRWIIDSKLFLVAEYNGKPIGFRWTLPDYNILIKKLNGKLGIKGFLYILLNRRKIDRGRFIVMGIDKEYQGKGIGTCMNYYNIIEMKKRGYKTAEYGWIDEKNIGSIKAGEKLGGKLYKIYRIYKKEI